MENQKQKPEQQTPSQEQKFTLPKRSGGRPKWIVPAIIVAGIIVLGAGAWAGYNYLIKPELISVSEKCAKEGESIGTCVGCITQCCEGLKGMNLQAFDDECAKIPPPPGSGSTCSNCGNGICDTQNDENKCTCPEDCKDEFVDWKTYRNEEYDYEISYPSKWNLMGNEVNKDSILAGLAISPFKEKDVLEDQAGHGSLLNILPLKLAGGNYEIVAEMKKRFLESLTPKPEIESSKVFLNDIEAIKIESRGYILDEDLDGRGEGLESKEVWYIFTYGENRFQISYFYPLANRDKYKPIFEEMLSGFKFIESEIVEFIVSIDLGELGGLITYYYEIFGYSDDSCVIKSKFLENPNPDWIDKEMICKYDNSKKFEDVILDTTNCQGELYILMNPMPKTMLYKGVSTTIPPLSLKVGFVKKEGENYIVSIEHIQESSCVKKEISVPAESYECKEISYFFHIHPTESNDNQITFSIQEKSD